MESEFGLIEMLKKKIPRSLQGQIGIGDDAAVLAGPGRERLLLTTDILVEGVDFKPKARPELVGRKALAVNLSDIAAMGGTPSACVVGLGLPRRMSEKYVGRVYGGMTALAKKFGVQIAGGDISRSPVFFISVAMLGKAGANEIITRAGARPGDVIGLTGRLGGSILRRHFLFTPRIAEGRFLAARFKPHAMIDISDGLVQDLWHILAGSKVSAALDLDRIPVSSDALRLARRNSIKALGHALTDGEDFELLFTLDPRKRERLERRWEKRFPRTPLVWIGKIEAGLPAISWTRAGRKTAAPRLSKTGFTHF